VQKFDLLVQMLLLSLPHPELALAMRSLILIDEVKKPMPHLLTWLCYSDFADDYSLYRPWLYS